MAIYAYGKPGDEGKSFVYDSLINQKISRFLWSWFHDCNLKTYR